MRRGRFPFGQSCLDLIVRELDIQLPVFDVNHDGVAFAQRSDGAARSGFGGDVSIDMYPQAIAADALAGVVDISLAANLRVGPVFTLEPRVGASILGVVGAGGAVGAPGFSGGAGLVVRFDSRTALRVDYTYRRLMSGDELYTVPSLTAGFIIHP